MNGEYSRPLYLPVRPLAVSVGALITAEGASPVVSASLVGLRIASQWGELKLLQVSASSTPSSGWFGGTVFSAEEFLCRDPESSSYRAMTPVAGEIPAMRCTPEERWGYFLELAQLYERPQLQHFAVRFIEGGMSFDVLGNGRSPDVRRSRLQLMLGGATDAIWYGNNSAFVPRGVVKARGTVTSEGRRVRGTIELAWRPSLVSPIADQLFEGALAAGVFFVPERKTALFVRVRGRVSVATRPATTVSDWADPTTPVSAGADLGVELTFGD